MMCTFGEFWWIFLIICVLSGFVIILAPTEATKVGLVSGAISLLSVVLLAIGGSATSTLGCKELKYQSVVNQRAELVRECPNREKPSCQVQWIKYQQDSLSKYLRVLQ